MLKERVDVGKALAYRKEGCVSDKDSTKLTQEELERLLRLLGWVSTACQSSVEDEKFLDMIKYKLRTQLKEILL